MEGTVRCRCMLLVLVLIMTLASVNSFAEWMMKDFCHVDIKDGAVIMNEEAEVSTQRTISVMRKLQDVHFVALTENDVYTPGESLYLQISSKEGQFVFDVITKNAELKNGGCEHGERYNKDMSELIMPNQPIEELEEVVVQAAWALGHEKVQITPSVVLKPSKNLNAEPATKQFHEAVLRSNSASADAAEEAEGGDSTNTGTVRKGERGVAGASAENTSIIEILYTFLWWILGASLLFGFFAVYRLNSRKGKTMRGPNNDISSKML